MNNYVGQLPNQSTSQVQSATVPPNSQMVNNQVNMFMSASLKYFKTNLIACV